MDLLDRALSRLEEILVCSLLVAACLLTFTQVVTRYGFGTTLSWGEELIINMLIWAGLIGSSLALRMGIHIGVDVFVKKFPPRVAKALTVLSVRFVIFLMSSGQMSIGLEIPMWIPYLCLPIAFGLMALRYLQIISRCWHDQPLHRGEISVEELQ